MAFSLFWILKRIARHARRTACKSSSLKFLRTQEPSSHIIGVHFTANGRRFVPQLTRSVQLLHYRSLAAATISPSALDAVGDLTHQAHAELIFQCKAGASRYDDEQSELRYIVHSEPSRTITDRLKNTRLNITVTHSTTVKRTVNQRVISIADVFCMSESENSKADEKPRIKCSAVEVEFNARSCRFLVVTQRCKPAYQGEQQQNSFSSTWKQ